MPHAARRAESALVDRAVRAARAGDRDGVRMLYVRYADSVYGYARSIVRDHRDAEDVTQHVFLKLMTVISGYEPRSMPFVAWLLTITRHAAIDHVRARRAVPCGDVRPRSESALDDRAAHCRRSLREALEHLPEDQRRVVVLRHVGGLAPAEIAAEMGRSEQSVYALHHKGRRTMRAELSRLGAAPVAARGA
jgi:RNA polymerase sigma-70 factor (ECF subfamily)